MPHHPDRDGRAGRTQARFRHHHHQALQPGLTGLGDGAGHGGYRLVEAFGRPHAKDSNPVESLHAGRVRPFRFMNQDAPGKAGFVTGFAA